MWNAEIIEALTCEAISFIAKKPEVLAQAYQEYTHNQPVVSTPASISTDHVEQHLSEIRRREQVVAELQVQARLDGLSIEPYKKMLLDLARERIRLEGQLESIQPVDTAEPTFPQMDFVSDLHEFFNDPEIEDIDKNNAYRPIIERIEITPPSPEARYQGRAVGLHLFLVSQSSLGVKVTILKKGGDHNIQISLYDKSNEAHK